MMLLLVVFSFGLVISGIVALGLSYAHAAARSSFEREVAMQEHQEKWRIVSSRIRQTVEPRKKRAA